MKHEDAQVLAADEGRLDRRVRPLDPASGTAGLWFTPQAVLDSLEGTEPAAVAAILGNPPPGR